MTKNTTIDNNKFRLILITSFRYCLGRRIYITSDCVEWLTEYWDILTTSDKRIIKVDIKLAIEFDAAGDKCDIESWKKVLELNKTEE